MPWTVRANRTTVGGGGGGGGGAVAGGLNPFYSYQIFTEAFKFKFSKSLLQTSSVIICHQYNTSDV